MIPSEVPDKVRLAVLVNRYAMPLAVVLIALGLVFSQPQAHVRDLSIGLLGFTIVFNIGIVEIIRRGFKVEPWMMKLRLFVNLGINAVLVYLLGGYWPPIWLLLSLTPIATAVYGTRGKTVFAAVSVSLVLLGVHALRRMNAPVDWGQQAAYAAYIIVLSLMINDLSHLARQAHKKSTPDLI